MKARLFQIYLCLATSVSLTVLTEESPSDGEKLFALKVQPLFAEKCLACHGNDPEKIKGSFDMRRHISLGNADAGKRRGKLSLHPVDAHGGGLRNAAQRSGQIVRRTNLVDSRLDSPPEVVTCTPSAYSD